MRDGLRGARKMARNDAFLNRAGVTGANQIRRQMADDCRVIAANCGGVLEADLELLGWLPTQIAAHGKDAARIARHDAVTEH